MARLIQKSGYIHSGDAGGYMKYIATRKGVEPRFNGHPATKKQGRLISSVLRDFPDSRELFEYQDYLAAPTVASASAFLTAALDTHAHEATQVGGYLSYIATRPGAEQRGAHGLFSAAPSVDLDAALKELDAHDGRVWTLIYSLRREDAARLGYDNADAWRALLLSKQAELAQAMKIPVQDFHWYAAYHDEGTHPHIHMMVWSADNKQGFLTREGIAAMRSKMTNAIFQDELLTLYQRKDVSYQELTQRARQAMVEAVRRMETADCDSPVFAEKLLTLAGELEHAQGKRQYGYLKKPLKKLVDELVDELAKLPEVAQCYELWNGIRDELEGYYKNKPREHLPLSRQKEFRAIKNAVVQEAVRLHVPTFEDEAMDDEPEQVVAEAAAGRPEQAGGSSSRLRWKQAAEYRNDKKILYDETAPPDRKRAALLSLERLWGEGFSVAAHLLGKLHRDGVFVPVDEALAERWFRRSAEAGNDYSEYALGKLLLGQKRIPEALEWLCRAANQENQFARYRLGKVYLLGEDVPKDVEKALEFLRASATQGNQYAQYTLGKLYLVGREVPRDREEAVRWLTLSSAQGNEYAQFFLDRLDQFRDPSVLMAAVRLVGRVGTLFQASAPPPANPTGIRMDSKRRRKLQEKRLAMGHKLDDHETYPHQI